MRPTSKILKAEKVEVTSKKLADLLQIQVGESAYLVKRVVAEPWKAKIPRQIMAGGIDKKVGGINFSLSAQKSGWFGC